MVATFRNTLRMTRWWQPWGATLRSNPGYRVPSKLAVVVMVKAYRTWWDMTICWELTASPDGAMSADLAVPELKHHLIDFGFSFQGRNMGEPNSRTHQ